MRSIRSILGASRIGVIFLLVARASSCAVGGEAAVRSPGQPAAPHRDPIAARSHLPMPWRIIGASFISLEKGEAGWLPGLMGDGYYLVDFTEQGLVWRHADIEDRYGLTLTKDDAFEVRERAGVKGTGRVDLVRGQLTWQGKTYRVRTYREIASEKEALDRAIGRGDGISPIRSVGKDTLEIDLKSEQMGRGDLNFGMGYLRAEYLGHHGKCAILRIHTNIELGQQTRLYRVPISLAALGPATIQAKGSLPTYSFAKAESKVIDRWQGGDPAGWTAMPVDRAHPANNHHSIVDASGHSSAYVWTTDMQRDHGAEVEPSARVNARVWFYTDAAYTMLRRGARQGEKITFSVDRWRDDGIETHGTDGVSKALDGLVRGMKAGGWRRAWLNQVVAQDLQKFLPGMRAGEVIYIELNLLDVEDVPVRG